MKTSTVVGLFAIQFVLFAVICGAVFTLGQNQLAEANARAAAQEMRAQAAEKQFDAVNQQLAAEKRRARTALLKLGG